jgi:hypothetical protein
LATSFTAARGVGRIVVFGKLARAWSRAVYPVARAIGQRWWDRLFLCSLAFTRITT